MTLFQSFQDDPGFPPIDGRDLHYSHVIVPEINILKNDHDPIEMHSVCPQSPNDDGPSNNNIKQINGIDTRATTTTSVVVVDDSSDGVSSGGGVGSSVDDGVATTPKSEVKVAFS
ncbi:hypothetical protein PoB_002643100 [Plakobranchus ocellatus]|uniref:Uncharacterized protein n=1 Tax=Plakobranchus ocellatus TaxID=259542 RepID=A0AAV3ZZH6_9GAST|nr:hypothetical protein PoB_002643100 [Plakobranchus ocellatus]